MCVKVGFNSQREASGAIGAIKRTSKRSHIPKRAYYCKKCNKWHLTSQA